MGPIITSAAISPSQVVTGGAYLVTVVVEDPILTIAKAETMTLTEIETVPLEKMTERSE